MMNRSAFLRHLWTTCINPSKNRTWIDVFAEKAENDPTASFADAGLALRRLLDQGASKNDIASIIRWASYEAVFGALYALSDPGVDDTTCLHESLLSADPSGREGRPKT